jgi:SsrA-binding protein
MTPASNQTTSKAVRVLITNRKARHEYHIEDTWEAGIVLHGTEVKSLRQGGGSLIDAFIEIRAGEAWILNFHIPPYDHGNRSNVETKRPRKLLLSKHEINRLGGKASDKGYTLIPLRVYFKGQLVKVEVALAKGKRDFDKRRDIKERDIRRDMDREMSRH